MGFVFKSTVDPNHNIFVTNKGGGGSPITRIMELINNRGIITKLGLVLYCICGRH